MKTKEADAFRVLLASDDSPSARSAMATALAFPWPTGAQLRVIAALEADWTRGRPEYVRIASRRAIQTATNRARRALRRRHDAEVAVVDGSPTHAILAEAKRWRADVIVIGWRGHGAFRRLLMGSVSRAVVRRAPCPTLVVPRRIREVRRLVIGFDGSPNAGRALAFVRGLTPRRGVGVTVVGVMEPTVVPTIALLPATVRATVNAELQAQNAKQLGRVRRQVASAVRTLARAGWAAAGEVRRGAPLAELLDVMRRRRAQVLVLGARATGGVERAVVGSVAEGALNRSPVPVLIVP
jgi:nucleotide-binding universal stress UspA family protein